MSPDDPGPLPAVPPTTPQRALLERVYPRPRSSSAELLPHCGNTYKQHVVGITHVHKQLDQNVKRIAFLCKKTY